MKTLITGAAGYVGSSLANRLKDKDLILVDNYMALEDGRPRIEKIGKHEIICADLRDPRVCQSITDGVDIAFHLAACSGIGKCQGPASYSHNVTGTTNLGVWCEINGVKKIVFASTSAVYGESQAYGITENHRVKPRARYGWQKYICELILSSLKIPCTILRKSNVYGHGLYHKKTAVDNFIDKALNNEDLTIHGSGIQRRDYVHIADAVNAYISAAYWDSGVYNIGGNDNLSINDLADLVIETSRKKIKKVYDDAEEPGRVLKHFVYESSKAKDLGYEPRETIRDEILRRLGCHNNPSE